MKVWILSTGHYYTDDRKVWGAYMSMDRAKSDGAKIAGEFFSWLETPGEWAEVDNGYRFEFPNSADCHCYMSLEPHEVIE
jgi:hypothetical protein